MNTHMFQKITSGLRDSLKEIPLMEQLVTRHFASGEALCKNMQSIGVTGDEVNRFSHKVPHLGLSEGQRIIVEEALALYRQNLELL